MWRHATAVGLGLGGAVGYGFYTQDEPMFKHVLIPLVHRVLDGEQAHRLGVLVAKHKLVPRREPEAQAGPAVGMGVQLWGLEFASPVGLAAGFDKDGEAVEGLARMGFASVEVGSVTPEPQPGNPKPRVFRLSEDQAVINRYGFNSAGHDAVHANLLHYVASERATPCVLGVNLGKNKTSPSAVADYSAGVAKFAFLADYLVINVSSPNTPGLRSLQGKAELDALIVGVLAARDEACGAGEGPPVLLKIAPDLTEHDKADIADVVRTRGVDGLVVANTTVSRDPTLKGEHKAEVGGLSGAPLRDLSTQVIRDMYRLTDGKVPIIGVGGVSNGGDAYDKLRAGASLVQLYSSLAYQGPPVALRVRREVEQLLRRDGFTDVSQVVGCDALPPKSA